MAAKRTITVNAPDGEVLTVNVGPTRVVGAIRLMRFTESFIGGARWCLTVHKTLDNAITGPNQTPAWNKLQRVAIEIDADDQPTGRWWPANKG